MEWYRRRSGQDARCDKAVHYSLVVDVAMDGLHTRLDRDTFMAGESSHRGTINATNDASCCIMMEKVRLLYNDLYAFRTRIQQQSISCFPLLVAKTHAEQQLQNTDKHEKAGG